MQTILDEFHKELDVLQQCVVLLNGLRSANALTPEIINTLPADMKKSIEISSDDPRLISGMLESLLILMVSRYEFFTKEIFKKLCDKAYCGVTANQITDDVKKQIIKKCIEVVRQDGKFGIVPAQKFMIFSNLAKLGNDSEVVSDINADYLALSKQIDADELKNLFGVLCKSEIWKVISQQAEFRQYFEGVSESTAMVQGKAKLDEIIRKRNEISHPNGPLFGVSLGADLIMEMMKFLRVLSGEIKRFCSLEVTSITTSRQSGCAE